MATTDANTTKQAGKRVSAADAELINIHAKSGWPAPQPLGRRHPPPFPIAALPQTIAEFAEAIGQEFRCPVDFAATGALVAVSALTSRKVRLNLNGTNWWQPTALFVITAAESGEGKPGFGMAVSPIRTLQAEARDQQREKIEADNTEFDIDTGRLAKLKKIASTAKKEEDRDAAKKEAAELALALAGKTRRHHPLLVVRADINEEGLRTRLDEQGGRLAILDDEGGALIDRMSRYSADGKSANVEAYLNAYDGAPIEAHRKGLSVTVPRTALAIGLAVQPEILNGLAKASGKRGLVERALIAMPPPLTLERKLQLRNPPKVAPIVWKRYLEGLRSLMRMPARDDGGGVDHQLDLAPDAYELLLDFRAEMDTAKANGALNSTSSLKAFGEKLTPRVARIAGNLWLWDRANEEQPWSDPVSRDAMERAIAIGRYYLEHFLIASDAMTDDQATMDARVILEWVDKSPAERRKLQPKDLSAGPRGFRGDRKRRDAALEVLEAHGLLVMSEEGEAPRTTRWFSMNPRRAELEVQTKVGAA